MLLPALVAVNVRVPALVSVIVLLLATPAPEALSRTGVSPDDAEGMVTVNGAMPLVSFVGSPMKEERFCVALLTTKEVVTCGAAKLLESPDWSAARVTVPVPVMEMELELRSEAGPDLTDRTTGSFDEEVGITIV